MLHDPAVGQIPLEQSTTDQKALEQTTPEAHASGDPPDTCPYVVSLSAAGVSPVIFASPHSGRNYPPEAFLAATRLAPLSLRRSEDSFMDELVSGVPAEGAALLSALFPRSFCDVNREAWELDPGMFEDALPSWVNTGSLRVKAGLGTIARVVSGGEAIYAEQACAFSDAEQRVVRLCWEPYHATAS